jgi:hypothetical protein
MYSLHSNEIGALVFHIFSLNKNIDIKLLLESVLIQIVIFIFGKILFFSMTCMVYRELLRKIHTSFLQPNQTTCNIRSYFFKSCSIQDVKISCCCNFPILAFQKSFEPKEPLVHLDFGVSNCIQRKQNCQVNFRSRANRKRDFLIGGKGTNGSRI